MSACVLLLTTCASREEADRIAEALVAEHLAACVQIETVESVYRWHGKVERAHEWRLQIKTISTRAGEAEARIAALHTYAVPEIVCMRGAASANYLTWVAEAVGCQASGASFEQ